MGIFRRNTTAAASRRDSKLIHTLCLGDGSDGLQNGAFADVPEMARQAECPAPVGEHSGAMSGATGEHQKQNGTSPSIPLRTSSRDAAGVNGLARSIFSRGRKLRSSASKLSLVSTISNSTIRTSASRDVSHGRSTPLQPTVSDGHGQSARPGDRTDSPGDPAMIGLSTASISHPSHFRHLAHAMPQQFSKIGSASHSDLVADFSAMRASQNSRRDFRGIRAVDLHSRTSSVETSTGSLTPSEASYCQSSATLSSASTSSRNSMHNPDRLSQLRGVDVCPRRSQESFSQPTVPARSMAVPAPLSPPPRKSSRKASTQYERESSAQRSDLTDKSGPSQRVSRSSADLEQGSEQSHGAMGVKGQSHEKAVEVEAPYAPSELLYPPVDWPLSHYGRALPCVDEEESTASTAVGNIFEDRRESRSRHGSDSAGSSPSGDSTSTVPPHYATPNSRKGSPPSDASLPEVFSAGRKVPRPIQRSSLNNGLFTSWSFEDEPLRNQSNSRVDCPTSDRRIQYRVDPSKLKAFDQSAARKSRIPVPADRFPKARNGVSSVAA